MRIAPLVAVLCFVLFVMQPGVLMAYPPELRARNLPWVVGLCAFWLATGSAAAIWSRRFR